MSNDTLNVRAALISIIEDPNARAKDRIKAVEALSNWHSNWEVRRKYLNYFGDQWNVDFNAKAMKEREERKKRAKKEQAEE